MSLEKITHSCQLTYRVVETCWHQTLFITLRRLQSLEAASLPCYRRADSLKKGVKALRDLDISEQTITKLFILLKIGRFLDLKQYTVLVPGKNEPLEGPSAPIKNWSTITAIANRFIYTAIGVVIQDFPYIKISPLKEKKISEGMCAGLSTQFIRLFFRFQKDKLPFEEAAKAAAKKLEKGAPPEAVALQYTQECIDVQDTSSHSISLATNLLAGQAILIGVIKHEFNELEADLFTSPINHPQYLLDGAYFITSGFAQNNYKVHNEWPDHAIALVKLGELALVYDSNYGLMHMNNYFNDIRTSEYSIFACARFFPKES
jgi:hypothetical protein